jgi:hypothetical protein
MTEHQLVYSSFTAIIDAPIDKVDIQYGASFSPSESVKAAPQYASPQDSRQHHKG